MNKNLLLFLSLVIVVNVSSGQIAYHDAINLKNRIGSQRAVTGKLLLNPNPDQILLINSIFKNYVPDSIIEDIKDDSTLFIAIKSTFTGNPFLAFGGTQESSSLLKNLSSSSKSTGLFESIGSLNVTSFADGLAKFLVERTKEELNIAFFEKLQKLSKKYPEFETLFPHAQALLDNFESWNYANILNTLREAFDKDLKELLINITLLPKLETAKCDDNEKCKKRIDSIKTFLQKPGGRIFLSAVLLGNGFLSGEKLPDVINKIADTAYMGAGFNSDATNTVQLINIVSFSLRNKDFGKNYVSFEDFETLINNDTTRRIYLGLLYQQIKNKKIHFNVFDNIAITSPASITEFENNINNYIKSILSQTDDLTEAIKNLNDAKKKGESDLSSQLAAIFETGSNLLEVLLNIHKIDPSITISQSLQHVFEYSKKTLEIAHDISVKNYSAAIVGTLTFMAEQLPDTDETKAVISEFVKYGSFAANVVQAKNSDEVKEAIRVIALPSGSSSIKRETAWNVAMNAYVGPYFGYEKIEGVDSSGKWNSYGITAPVGISISRGHSILFAIPTNWSFSSSVFISLIDIGALTAFRFTNDSAEKVPDIQLKHILSPGIFYSLGIPKTPLSFNVGYQVGPLLRKVNLEENEFSEKYNRWSISLCVDIPLINFFTAPRRKEKN